MCLYLVGWALNVVLTYNLRVNYCKVFTEQGTFLEFLVAKMYAEFLSSSSIPNTNLKNKTIFQSRIYMYTNEILILKVLILLLLLRATRRRTFQVQLLEL